MRQLILEPTTQAQWQTLVHEAQSACDRELDETLESYLVFLLMRFATRPHCMSRIMAEDYLNSQVASGGSGSCGTSVTIACCSPGCFRSWPNDAWYGSAISSISASPPTSSFPTCWTVAGHLSTAISPRPLSC